MKSTQNLGAVMRLRDIFSYKNIVTAGMGDNPEFVKVYPIKEPLVPRRNFQVGIEVEAENFILAELNRSFIYAHSQHLWKITGDPSLRNNGIELQSFPCSGKNLAMSLDFLNRINDVVKPDYNDRTGIHVHLNVRDMTVGQWMSLIALYVLYEPALFRFSGGREHNVYCVPLRTGSHKLPLLFCAEKPEEEIVGTVAMGNKYMALNYLPTAKEHFGTVEFRHMVGTSNVGWIKAWVDLIQHLRTGAAQPYDKLMPTIYGLTENNYKEFTEKIFCEDAHLIRGDDLWKEIREGIIILKQWGIQQESYAEYIEDTKKIPVRASKKGMDNDAFEAYLQRRRAAQRPGGRLQNQLDQAIQAVRARGPAVRGGMNAAEVRRREEQRFGVAPPMWPGVQLHPVNANDIVWNHVPIPNYEFVEFDQEGRPVPNQPIPVNIAVDAAGNPVPFPPLPPRREGV